MLKNEGKSIVVQGKILFCQNRYFMADESPFFKGQAFTILENKFLETVLAQDKELILRGRYHNFKGQNYLFLTHIHSRSEVVFPGDKEL